MTRKRKKRCKETGGEHHWAADALGWWQCSECDYLWEEVKDDEFTIDSYLVEEEGR